MSRPLTDIERQQLYSFWYQQVQESFSSEALEDELVALYTRDFTLGELTAINQFYETSVGMKWRETLPSFQQELGETSSHYLLELAADNGSTVR